MLTFSTGQMHDITEQVRRPSRPLLLKQVLEDLPDFYPRLDDEACIQLAEDTIDRAARWSIGEASAVVDFARLMVEVAVDFDKHPLTRAILSETNVHPDLKPRLLCELIDMQDWAAIAETGARIPNAQEFEHVRDHS